MYLLIGISMVLAGGMLASFALSIVLTLAWPLLRWAAARLSPAVEAWFWLAVGGTPACGGAVIALALVGPGYLLFEPRHTEEHISIALAAIAATSIALFIAAMTRSGLLLHRSARMAAALKNSAKRLELKGITAEAYEIPTASRLTTVFGVGRPTMFISSAVLHALGQEELETVVRHEQAHVKSWDNVRALLLDIACWLSGNPVLGSAVKSHWVEAAELAADDSAAMNGDDAVALLSALVKVARLRDGDAPAFACSFLPKATKVQLKRRVERLRAIADGTHRESAAPSHLGWVAGLAVVAGVIAFAAAGVAPMAWAHSMLEVLVKL